MASLPQVIILPGFMGTHIDVVPLFLPSFRLWVSYPPLIAGFIDYLRLQDDGVTGAVIAPGIVEPNGLVMEYYLPLLRRLHDDGWSGHVIGYDWRRSLLTLGNSVYDEIVGAIGTDDYSIVSHSAGGLLARMVWRRAAQLGTTGRIKRMVNLACPHYGSYMAVQAFAGVSDLYRNLALITSLNITIRDIGRSAAFPRSDFLDRILGTWPQLYELMPQVQQPNANDPDRQFLYSKANWGSRFPRISQDRLNIATNTHLALNALTPPDNILVDVVGRGVNTAASLRFRLLDIDQLRGYLYDDGDGTVTRASAQLGGRAAEIFSLHADIVRHPEVLSSITRWLQQGLPAQPPIEIHVMPFGDLGPAGLPGPSRQTLESRSVIELFDPGRFPSSEGIQGRPSYCP